MQECCSDDDFCAQCVYIALNNGETVVALIGNEATVKKVYRESGGQVRLQPANAAMQPIMVGEGDLAIRGVVVGLMRHYR